jgi:hypothetical protein
LIDNELRKKLDSSGAVLIRGPKSLNIITGTGISYTRSDRINVVSLASLGA